MLATILSDARSQNGMTRAQVSERTGVPVGTLFNWETGRCRPRTWSGIATVATTLSIPVESLIVA